MFELTIGDSVYSFKFGIGFVRDINKRVLKSVEDTNKKQELGLQYAVAGLIDEDPIELVDILLTANKTENPRITAAKLESYLEDESTDMSALCNSVLDFFARSNATKKVTNSVLEMVAKQTENQNQ